MFGKIILGVVIVSFLSFTGCLPPTRLEMDYGTSHKLSKFNQILDPEAEKNLEPVEGFDGVAAEGTKERYDKGFEKETKPPTYTLSIGGVAMGGGGKK
jgi:hypothetical protein